MRRVMMDLETLGVGVDALVVQIGAVTFDGMSRFKRTIDPRDCQKNGAVLDADTVMWWLGQSQEARESVAKHDSLEIPAFNDLNEFLSGADEIWSHSTFDFVIVMNVLHRLNIRPKFSFRNARDIRTLISLADFKKIDFPAREGTHHDALDDALYQVGYCRTAFTKLGKFCD